MKTKLYTHDELHKNWMKDPEYRREYNKLEPEFQIARQIIDARLKKKLSQKELAQKAGTNESVISRLEGMDEEPSILLLSRIAQVLDTRIQITLPA